MVRLHYLVAQTPEHFDVRKDLLSASDCLLGRIGERRNVAIFHALFQLFELGRSWWTASSALESGNSTSCGSDASR